MKKINKEKLFYVIFIIGITGSFANVIIAYHLGVPERVLIVNVYFSLVTLWAFLVYKMGEIIGILIKVLKSITEGDIKNTCMAIFDFMNRLNRKHE